MIIPYFSMFKTLFFGQYTNTMFYKFNDFKNKLDIQPEHDFVGIIPLSSANNYHIINKYVPKIPNLFMDFHFSKLENSKDFIYGYINIPDILVATRSIISFILTRDYVVFIDRDEYVAQAFQKMSESSKNQDAFRDSGCVLYFLLDYIMAKDLEKINSLQQNLVQLELEVLNEKNLDIIKEITNYRSRTMKLHHYYVQLEGILQDLEDDISDLISNEAKEYFNILIRKTTMFGHESEQIWEYTSQIRDIYQQQLDVHQNAVMKFLTVVTTLFMPLTLIVGWYGMNFEHMPELEFKYSYPIVFVFSLLLVIIMCVIFKRKKWW